jgi:hypothetical protein
MTDDREIEFPLVDKYRDVWTDAKFDVKPDCGIAR